MEGVKRNAVKLVEYKEEWIEEFFDVKKELEIVWRGNIVDIQHIGSTAIQGMRAKPILDVAVVVNSFKNMDISKLEKLGYEYCGYQTEEKDRCLFVMRGLGEISLRHIHCYEPDNLDYLQCVWFKNYLNDNPEISKKYAMLKQELYEKYPDDRKTYSKGKEKFIQEVYSKLEISS